MKLMKYLLVVAALIPFSCSKDHDAKPSEPTLSLSTSQQVVSAPTALQNSEDSNAQMAEGWIETANVMSDYMSYFKAPANATKSSTAITASNARVASTGVTVYTWYDANSGYNIAYQITETSTAYSFDVFLMSAGDTKWLKYIHAEETKDKTQGSMRLYDIFGIYSSSPSYIWMDYSWATSGDNFSMTITDHSEGLRVELAINKKTKAGSVRVYDNNIIDSEYTWDSKGNGTWKTYDSQGTLEDQGTWTN